MCNIRHSQETLDLHPNAYVSAADGAAASSMAVQAHTGMTLSIAINAGLNVAVKIHVNSKKHFYCYIGGKYFFHSSFKILGSKSSVTIQHEFEI